MKVCKDGVESLVLVDEEVGFDRVERDGFADAVLDGEPACEAGRVGGDGKDTCVEKDGGCGVGFGMLKDDGLCERDPLAVLGVGDGCERGKVLFLGHPDGQRVDLVCQGLERV